ncbi:hypothetical protein [Propionibacterium freudenreichii]|uniref:hypothetical protein n=1 Tax=Propionibacterium freudenreichii TaxID=1744 RepID=UPI00254BE497|nr:hypothetical protein [Propionibacterium freudenreichii]MDK9640950.1 hypothetical protein [Propionibacterium freudenreichii]
MARDPIRTVEAYSIHGHVASGTEDESLLDYPRFFQHLLTEDLRVLRMQLGDDVVAISEQHEDGQRLSFRFVIGNTQDLPLVYDLDSATATEINPGTDRLVVRGAWVFALPGIRLLFVEKKRPGVPIFQIERFLSNYGRSQLGLDGLTISLNPVPSSDFAQEIEEMTRVREATIVMRRPNYSWTATAGELIGGPATESNAASVRLQVSADRGQSLEKKRGVVHDLLGLVSRPITGLKNAIVKGNSPHHVGERTISLERSKVKASKRISKDASDEELRDSLGALASETAEAIVTPTPIDGHGGAPA